MTAAAEFASEPGPRHVAVIMDGNGRWAQARGLFRTAGHRSGMEAVRRTVEAARALGMRAIQFSSVEKLREDLAVLGLAGELPLL